jgi:knotted carbamoyltransferase YgeW
MTNTITKHIESIANVPNGMHGKDFLLTWEKTKQELELVLDVALLLKQFRGQNISPKVFESGLAVSNFRDKSTRTRFSFASAANLLGLSVQDLDEEKSQISHGETVRETAAMISFLSDFIGIRDDMFLGEGNRYMREVAASLDESHQEGILPVRPGVINLQCDMDHPTQSMADLLHLKQFYGSLDALRGKRIVMSWAYSPSYGKPLSVPQGIIALLTRFGMDVTLAHPKGYDLIPEVLETASGFAKESGGKFSVSHSMDASMQDAHIVYPKSWAPYHIMEERTKLLKVSDKLGLRELEQQCLADNAQYIDWEYDQQKMKNTHKQNALYMHCLPADISGVSCERGEVQADVFEKSRLQTYAEAAYKPYIIAAMMMTNKYESPGEMLNFIFERNQKRVLSVL